MANKKSGTRTEPTAASKVAAEALELLEGDWDDKAANPQELIQETSRGPWAVYSGPVSMRDLDKVQNLLDGEDVPLENMVDVLIILAHTATGDLMFRTAHREKLLTRVDPVYIVDAAKFLGETATEALSDAEEEAGEE